MIKAKKARCLQSYTLSFSRIIERLGGEAIAFVSYAGEPLVDCQIIERIKEARSFGFRNIILWTNGILLHKYDPKDLLGSGIDSMFISTAPFEKERFELIYRNRGYGKLLAGLRENLAVNKRLGKPVKIEICLRSDIPRRKALALNDYREYIKPYIDNEKKEISVLVNGYDNWSGMITDQDLIGHMEFVAVTTYKPRPCRRMFELLIKWDGKAKACGCRFGNSGVKDDLDIGCLESSSLKAIWFGDRLKQMRRSFINKTINVLCRDCGLYAPV